MKAGRRKEAVGIVGLGIMGGSFARNLMAAGWRVVGFDIDSGISRAMAKAGVEIVADVKTLAESVPTIITSLPTAGALEATVAAICEVELPPKVIVEASVFALGDKLRAKDALGKVGHTTIDCPVSGTGVQAAVKDIVFYASGDSKVIAKLRPMFLSISRGFFDVGEYGNGSKMKFVANLLVAVHNVVSAEAMVLGMKSGLDPQLIVELIGGGAGTSRMFEARAPMMARNNYQDNQTAKINVFQKDLDVIGSFATQLGVPTPTFSATAAIYSAARSMGYGMQDPASVCAVIERMAALKRGRTRKAVRRNRQP